MMIIREAQLEAFDQARRKDFVAIALAHFKDHDRPVLLALIEHAETQAQEAGFASHHGVLCLLEVILKHGKDFQQKYSWARSLLSYSENGDETIRLVHEVLMVPKQAKGAKYGR